MLSGFQAAQWQQGQRERNMIPGEEIVEIGGKDYLRNKAKLCPSCGCVFYGYQRYTNPSGMPAVDPNPRLHQTAVAGRETCGYPECLDMENTYQFGRRRAAMPHAEAPSLEPVKLVRKGSKGLQPLMEAK